MSETNATILIPDISGFTEFMTTTELTHASHAINYLIDAIVNAVGDEYEVSEIEGDAVLLLRKGPAPSRAEILETCLKIFNAFHYQRKWMQQHTVCPCGACQAIINLSLKFVAHHGPLAEIKVGRFTKASGPEMIVAHRLLKNSIGNQEYLLLTERLLQSTKDNIEAAEPNWFHSSEEYASIGKVDYRFTLLNEAKKNVPEPPPLQTYRSDNTAYFDGEIGANYFDLYMTLMNIPGRPAWVPGLKKVEQAGSDVYIGSVHTCTFDDHQTIVTPLRMTVSDEGIMFAERCKIEEKNIELVYEYVFRKQNETTCDFSCRYMNATDLQIPENENQLLAKRMKLFVEGFKNYCVTKKL
jgi:hypothetical protein